MRLPGRNLDEGPGDSLSDASRPSGLRIGRLEALDSLLGVRMDVGGPIRLDGLVADWDLCTWPTTRSLVFELPFQRGRLSSADGV